MFPDDYEYERYISQSFGISGTYDEFKQKQIRLFSQSAEALSEISNKKIENIKIVIPENGVPENYKLRIVVFHFENGKTFKYYPLLIMHINQNKKENKWWCLLTVQQN